MTQVGSPLLLDAGELLGGCFSPFPHALFFFFSVILLGSILGADKPWGPV